MPFVLLVRSSSHKYELRVKRFSNPEEFPILPGLQEEMRRHVQELIAPSR